MHILFLTHYFPPEVNAPASRTFENTKRWVGAGHEVTVLTCAPNHPNGILYPGYKNRLWQWDEKEGVRILRVKTYLSANKGFLKRILNYFSYMVSAVIFSFLLRKVDVVVSTSPQFFCGFSGYWVSRLKRCKWVLEIRDLWPESIIAVGALSNKQIIKILESIESFMYRKADKIVSVTNSFKIHILAKGIDAKKISIVTNGADLQQFAPMPKQNRVSDKYSLEGKFVASYIGTHGMAHTLETILNAADTLREEANIVFVLVGDGAERENLLTMKEDLGLDNVLMLPQQPREKIVEYLAASDACLVILRKNDLFKTVIPSKIFEAMAMARPVILGVEGESKDIIEKAECGICIEPENFKRLAETVLNLSKDKEYAERLGLNGRKFVVKNYDRTKLAMDYLDIFKELLVKN